MNIDNRVKYFSKHLDELLQIDKTDNRYIPFLINTSFLSRRVLESISAGKTIVQCERYPLTKELLNHTSSDLLSLREILGKIIHSFHLKIDNGRIIATSDKGTISISLDDFLKVMRELKIPPSFSILIICNKLRIMMGQSQEKGTNDYSFENADLNSFMRLTNKARQSRGKRTHGASFENMDLDFSWLLNNEKVKKKILKQFFDVDSPDSTLQTFGFSSLLEEKTGIIIRCHPTPNKPKIFDPSQILGSIEKEINRQELTIPDAPKS